MNMTMNGGEAEAIVPILVKELQGHGDSAVDVVSNCSEREEGATRRRLWSPWGIVKDLVSWFVVMREAFGVPFLGVVMIVYGVSQGYAGTMKRLATNYYWRDVLKMQPASTQAFMSLSWGSLAVGGLFGCGVSGAAVHSFGAQGSYLLVSVAPLMLIVAALALSENRLPKTSLNFQFEAPLRTLRLFGQTLRDPVLWKPALYIYLSQGSLCPDISEAMFFWFTDPVSGPGFSEEFMGLVNAVGYLAMFIGVAGFNHWCQSQTFRKMFLWPQVTFVP